MQHATYPDIGMKRLLPKLAIALAGVGAKTPSAMMFKGPVNVVPVEDHDVISQAWLWPRMGQFFRPHDVVVGETGTSSFGLTDVAFPEGATFVAQILWGSIGWSVGK